MKVRLLRKVQKAILAEPESLEMGSWHSFSGCRTTHCIGGWGQFLTDGTDGNLGVEYYYPLFGVSHQSGRLLMFVDNWPRDLRRRYGFAKKPLTRAKIACERIDIFIESKGKI